MRSSRRLWRRPIFQLPGELSCDRRLKFFQLWWCWFGKQMTQSFYIFNVFDDRFGLARKIEITEQHDIIAVDPILAELDCDGQGPIGGLITFCRRGLSPFSAGGSWVTVAVIPCARSA